MIPNLIPNFNALSLGKTCGHLANLVDGILAQLVGLLSPWIAAINSFVPGLNLMSTPPALLGPVCAFLNLDGGL